MSQKRAAVIADMPLLAKRPSPAWDVEAGLRFVASPSTRVTALTAIICIAVGVLHPIATEATKTAKLTVCNVVAGEVDCGAGAGEGLDGSLNVRMVMPFHAATLTITAELVAMAVCFCICAVGAGSATRAAHSLVSIPELLRFMPLGLIYGFGDFVQTVACNAASAPVILIVGQSKLLLAALLSRMFLAKKQKTNWFRLVTITCAAIAGTDIGAGELSADRAAELYGALLALAKATLSSAGAVLGEKCYKTGSSSFWATSFQVQLMMLVASLALLPWTAGQLQKATVFEFFSAGPYPLCSECASIMPRGGQCTCVDRQGWDIWTALAVVAIVMNGLATGLTLRYLSAVTKSVCNAVGAGVFYVIYIWIGFRPFNIAQAMVMTIVALSSYEYAMEKIGKPAAPQAKEDWDSEHLRDAVASSHPGFSGAGYKKPASRCC